MGDMADYHLDTMAWPGNYPDDGAIDDGIWGLRSTLADDRAADGMWLCADGTRIPIANMTDLHLLNAKRMMDGKGWESPYHRVLLNEIRRRGLRYP